MDLTGKVEKWLKNLRLFALNSDVHCSREEKEINNELIGTRHVNLAFNQMIKHMHLDLGFEYDNNVVDSPVIVGGNQVLLFTIGTTYYYTDISKIHEIIVYPAKNYNEFKLDNSSVIISILNWYEGLIPVINTDFLLKQEVGEANNLLIYDIGKEIYAFTVSNVVQKYEVDASSFGQQINVNNQNFKYLDLLSFEKELINQRMSIKKF